MTIVSKPFKFFLLFVLLLVPLSQSPLDYFKLVLQWPPSNPKSNPRHYPKPLNFTIHGLWPESYIGWQPKCFPGGSYTSFTPASDQTLLQRLQMSWPDVQNGNNDWFWSHEWEDHGVYSLSSYNQRAYFTLAVDLKDRYDILWHLTSVNFKPGGTYKDEASIENAIMSCTTKTPELVCTPRSANTKSLLEVRICFDSNLAVMDCPGKSLSKDKACSQTKIFLPK